MFPQPDGEGFVITKCKAFASPITVSQVVDYDFALKFWDLCWKYGLDTYSSSEYISFAIGLYRQGLLTQQDTGGMELAHGSPEAVFYLLEKIVRREGIGDVLANGVYRAARQIGNGAEKFAYHTKKLEIQTDLRGRPEYALPNAVSDRVDRSRLLSGASQTIWQHSPEEREQYLKEGFFGYPREFEKYYFADWDPTGADYEGLCRFVAYDLETLNLIEATGGCLFWQLHVPYPAVSHRSQVAALIAAATGMDIDEDKATEIARRIINLVRAYNVREGLKRDDIPDMSFQKARIPPFQQFDRALFEKWLDRYYEIRGWDRDGIPTGETLEALGLDDVRQELERRGLLTMSPVPATLT
ncbi:MAG: aldehyde ferredoxin oxidoreductase C-terminal domain-containing protein [Dehalococcoidales bacterium]|nr:aldehyde ferredoxin oxidoreductase C-terminal domain-containing protein [Dehalococcoidales bacterium]MDZ4230542.1 aldehyde ferredoxin oxidoreductase C-terminal domain-containing protein [Dehalococcoidales bacterium]